MLAPGAPRWQRVLAAFGDLRADRELESTRLGVDASARIDRSSLDNSSTISPRVVASASRGFVAASASFGEGYAPPSLADQFFHEGVLVRPNPALRAERTRDDVEGRVSLREVGLGRARVSAEAAVYHADIDGMILWLPDFQFVWSPTNNNVRRSGWELTSRGALDPDISVQATIDRADVVYAGPVLSGQVAYRPRTTSTITLAAGPRIAHVEIATRYVGARRTVPGSGLNSLDPYWLSDARVSTAWTAHSWLLDATAGIENVFDQRAAMLIDYPFPSRSWTLGLRVRRVDREP
jgi:outer membrane cobalamin receptor